jgi:hypothetical protein
MKKIAFSIIFAAILLGSTTISCFAGDGWQSNILISSGSASSKLTFGQNPAATDLNDGFYDVPAMLSGHLKAAFTDSEETLWRDIRGVGSENLKEWQLSITSGSRDIIKIIWDKKSFPKDARVTLIDTDTGKSIDMKMLSSYAMENRDVCELLIKVTNT